MAVQKIADFYVQWLKNSNEETEKLQQQQSANEWNVDESHLPPH